MFDFYPSILYSISYISKLDEFSLQTESFGTLENLNSGQLFSLIKFKSINLIKKYL